MTAAPFEPEWLTYLRSRVEATGSIKAAATEVGISRPAASTLLAGKYPAGTDRMAAKIAAHIEGERVWCPHLRAVLAAESCAGFASAPVPTADPAALRHWAACRRCPNRDGGTS